MNELWKPVPDYEDYHNAKLTNKQARYIRENPDNLTTLELGKMFGVCPTKISAIQRGKTYKVAGGSLRKGQKRTTLTDDLRKQIRNEYICGSAEFGSTALAKKYGICQRTVLNIIRESQS